MTLLLVLLSAVSAFANPWDCSPVDLLIVGDSQVGASWSKSYTGNFLPACLKSNFVLYGRGGTVPGNWLGAGSMHKIETIERNNVDEQLNIGSLDQVPLCKKSLEKMLETHQAKKIVFNFGGNYIGTSIDQAKIKKDLNRMMEIVEQNKIEAKSCFFFGPSFEMQVKSKRNVPHRNLSNVLIVNEIIRPLLANRCQFFAGNELMANSAKFDGKEFLKRLPIQGRSGCMGANENDNVHICGEAAQDLAQRMCDIINATY